MNEKLDVSITIYLKKKNFKIDKSLKGKYYTKTKNNIKNKLIKNYIKEKKYNRF